MAHAPCNRGSRLDRPASVRPGWLGLVALVGVLLVSHWAGAASARPLFAPPVGYPTGSGPVSVALADLSADGKPDLVTANIASNTVSVLLGDGAGGFGPKTDLAALTTPVSVALADLNADGDLDLAVVEFDASTVSVRLGNGTGGFGSPTAFITETHPTSVAIGDLDGDGNLDMAVAKQLTNEVSVLLGDGAGGFGGETDYPAGFAPAAVAIGDLDGDATPDVAVTNSSANTVSVLLGNGGGTLGPKTDFACGNVPTNVVIADLNDDGNADLAIVNGNGTNTVSVLLGNGDGTFGPRTAYPGGANSNWVAIGDVNRDGRPDLVVANADDNTVSVLLGNGDGTFGAKSDFATGNHPPMVAIGDLNADGNLDVVTANQYANTVSVLLSQFSPGVASVQDVPNDQGGKVHVLWDAAFLDTAPSYGISAYNLWRRITLASALQALERGATLLEPAADVGGGVGSRTIRVTAEGAQAVYWEFVASVPARGQSGYGYMATTTSDSMASGIPWNVFFVDAQNASSPAFYVSLPDSGYSVDNLPPGPPALFAGEYLTGSNATVLTWGDNLESDFSYYKLYRGSSAGFEPGPGNLIATQGDAGYTDAGTSAHYYKLSAVDVHGNESGYALLEPGQTVGVGGSAPAALALEGAWPNPARGQELAVRFALPNAAPARIELVDVSGRRVVAREVGSLGPGRHAVDLAAGRPLPSGLYLVRLAQGGQMRVARVVVLD